MSDSELKQEAGQAQEGEGQEVNLLEEVIKATKQTEKDYATSLMKTLWATGGEGATGFGQFLTEETNLGIAKGQTLAEALKETSTKVFSKEALEATLQEAFGGGLKEYSEKQ